LSEFLKKDEEVEGGREDREDKKFLSVFITLNSKKWRKL
jgi:hypothetical protein